MLGVSAAPLADLSAGAGGACRASAAPDAPRLPTTPPESGGTP